jgi:hypothetical protein
MMVAKKIKTTTTPHTATPTTIPTDEPPLDETEGKSKIHDPHNDWKFENSNLNCKHLKKLHHYSVVFSFAYVLPVF